MKVVPKLIVLIITHMLYYILYYITIYIIFQNSNPESIEQYKGPNLQYPCDAITIHQVLGEK